MFSEEVLTELLDKRYLIFAPKNPKDLRNQYPELLEYPEFRPEVIKQYDILFVWWFRCAASPYYDMQDSEKLKLCVERSYPTDQQKENKFREFSAGIPDNIKSACKRMESFNLSARVENYLYTKRVRENCKELLAKKVEDMDPDEQESWSKRAAAIWKLFEETTKTLEKGGFGVSEQNDTLVSEVDGSVRAFRQSGGR